MTLLKRIPRKAARWTKPEAPPPDWEIMPTGPESLGNAFVLATQAGMELTGKTVEHRDGKLLVVD